MEEAELRLEARSKLEGGALPLEPATRLWVCPGIGETCSLCEELISVRDLEYEVEHAVGVKLIVRHFHRRCFAVWELERGA
jgi:hypothetical protein